MSDKKTTPFRLFFQIFPFIRWLRHYNLKTLQADSLAGLTVAVILIPQAMAYAMLAGLPPVYGLYAAAVTPVIGGLWGSLRQLATGPIAITSLLVLVTLSPLAAPGSPRYIELALLLSIIIGILYLCIGFLRMGQIMAFVSHSAVKGFTAAAALIIIASQLPQFLGISVRRHEYIFFMVLEISAKIRESHLLSALIGILCFGFIYTMKKHRPAFPSSLTALTIATGSVFWFGLDARGVAIIGKTAGGLPGFHLPVFNPEIISTLFGPAMVIALVCFVETYSVGKAISDETRQKVNVNQEFIGQGMANLIGGFFQCYPVSGSFSRTAINFSSGARTGIASVISGILVIVTLLFFTPVLTYIPRAGLAAVVISAVLTLFHPSQVFKLWKMNRDDGIVALTVFMLALLAKPDYALLIGVVMSLMFFFWKTMHPRIVEMTRDPEHHVLVNAEVSGSPACPQILQLRIDNVIFFANAEYTMEHIMARVNAVNTPLKFLLKDFQAVGYIDITGIDELRRLKELLRQQGIRLALFNVHAPVLKTFISSGFYPEMQTDGIIESSGRLPDLSQILTRLVDAVDHDYCRDNCPYSLFEECKNYK